MLDGPGGPSQGAQERPRGEVDNPFNPETGPYGRLDREPADEAPGGEARGGPLGGGLDSLIDGFRRGGLGDVIESWIGGGQNRAIQPQQLAQALGTDTVDTLSRQTGLGRDDLLAQLAQVLPGVVDGLTPQGRRPNRDEMGTW
ncbi:MAG: YidB family protein [Methylobacterium frigidaeris]